MGPHVLRQCSEFGGGDDAECGGSMRAVLEFGSFQRRGGCDFLPAVGVTVSQARERGYGR